MVADLTEEAFHKQFNLNVLGYFLGVREAVTHFGEAGGSIVNISSILSTHPSAGGSVYSATKGAVDNMTYGLARELGPRNIRVNAIMPGYTNTPATDGAFVGDLRDRLLAETPLGRVGEPEDIAPTAVFLASDDSHWISGESIRVTGGARGL
jgi:3-oxoacyl-[acyl-carrier protein] reductase